jgi:hypothetical protein
MSDLCCSMVIPLSKELLSGATKDSFSFHLQPNIMFSSTVVTICTTKSPTKELSVLLFIFMFRMILTTTSYDFLK